MGIIKEVESLRRTQVEERHSLQDALAELRRAVQGCTAAIESVKTDVRAVQDAVANAPSRTDVKLLVDSCVRDPSGEMCALIRGEVQKVVNETLAAEEPLEHESALAYLQCDTCRPQFVTASREVPEFTAAILDQLVGERDVEALIRVLMEQGYQVQKKAEKKDTFLQYVREVTSRIWTFRSAKRSNNPL